MPTANKESARKTTMNGIKVYVASPYTLGDVAINVRRQVLAADALMNAGYVPYTPLTMTHLQHLLCPRPYEDWIEWDKPWVLACDVLLRLDGESKGADGEVALAMEHGIPVFFSLEDLVKTITDDWKLTPTRDVSAAERTLRHLGYTDEGGEMWKPPLGKPPVLLTDQQIKAGLAAANAVDSTFDFGDGSTATEREAAHVTAFRVACGE